MWVKMKLTLFFQIRWKSRCYIWLIFSPIWKIKFQTEIFIQKVELWIFSLMKKHHKTTMKYATESVLNFRSDSMTQSECAVHSGTLKADLIISFHIFFFLCFFQVCAVMLQLYPCLFSLQNQILIELKWEILSYWYAKWRIWVSWSAASELSLKLYLISPLYNLTCVQTVKKWWLFFYEFQYLQKILWPIFMDL